MVAKKKVELKKHPLSGTITFAGKHNVYAIGKKGEELRVVSVGNGKGKTGSHWRIGRKVPNKEEWIWLDAVEYETPAYALRKYT
jgi:hypothetical protein